MRCDVRIAHPAAIMARPRSPCAPHRAHGAGAHSWRATASQGSDAISGRPRPARLC